MYRIRYFVADSALADKGRDATPHKGHAGFLGGLPGIRRPHGRIQRVVHEEPHVLSRQVLAPRVLQLFDGLRVVDHFGDVVAVAVVQTRRAWQFLPAESPRGTFLDGSSGPSVNSALDRFNAGVTGRRAQLSERDFSSLRPIS